MLNRTRPLSRLTPLATLPRNGGRVTRALATQAPVLLADAPVPALDSRHQFVVSEVLKARTGAGATAVAILHDLTLTARFANRIVLLDQGKPRLPAHRTQPCRRPASLRASAFGLGSRGRREVL